MTFDLDSLIETDADGILGSRREWNALLIGIAIGFVSLTPVPKTREFVYHVVGLLDEDGNVRSRSMAVKEARRESVYAAGGIALGAVLAIAFGVLATVGLLAAPEAVDGELLDLLDQLL